MLRRLSSLLLLAVATTGCASMRGGKDDGNEAAAPGATARATMRDAAGASLGDVSLTQTPTGVLLVGSLSGLPEGTHGFHVHAAGRCAPTFDAAGPHLNPGTRQHGYRNAQAQHAGDLPNVTVPPGGTIRIELFTTLISLGRGGTGVFDGDGSALVLHANADDYQTDPSGASGTRIACGVISR